MTSIAKWMFIQSHPKTTIVRRVKIFKNVVELWIFITHSLLSKRNQAVIKYHLTALLFVSNHIFTSRRDGISSLQKRRINEKLYDHHVIHRSAILH